MEEFQISCVVQNSNGVITHVGIGGKTHPVMDIVNWILNRTYMFYTIKNGYKATVYAKQSTLGNWFLTTEPDSTKVNNLDFLRVC